MTHLRPNRRIPSEERRYRSRESHFPWIFVIIAFASGYLFATLMSTGHFFNFISEKWAHASANSKKELSKSRVVEKPTLPKPKFEFYTLLSNDSGAKAVQQKTTSTAAGALVNKIREPVLKEITTSEKIVESPSKETYSVQVASFNRKEDAEHLRASLMLRGFQAQTTSTIQQNMTWYRVILGPFKTRTEAEKAHKDIFGQEHLKGVVRRMDG